MKKILSLLFAFLLLTAIAAAAETEEETDPVFYLMERRMTVTEDGCCTIQLRLLKEGGIAYCLDEMDITLLDAENNAIEPLSMRMVAPLNPVPAGDQAFPVTLIFTLPEGAEPEAYHIGGVPGESFAEPSAEPMELDCGHILSHSGDGPAVTCWLEKPATEPAYAGHMMILHVFDMDGAYLGTQALSWETADCVVSGASAREKLAELSRLPEDVLDYYALSFNPDSSYYFFADVPLTGLLPDDIPVRAFAETYRTKSPLQVAASAFEPLEDGRWRAFVLLQNGSCEPVHFSGHDVALYDAQGNAGLYSQIWFDCALWELEPFSITAMQYTFDGLPADFIPAQIRVTGRVTHQEAPCTLKRLPDEHVQVTETDGMLLMTATIPYDLCGKTLSNNESSCAGLIWYARDPQTRRMLSCGSVTRRGEERFCVGEWSRYKPIEIPGIPEGVMPEILVFFIDEK